MKNQTGTELADSVTLTTSLAEVNRRGNHRKSCQCMVFVCKDVITQVTNEYHYLTGCGCSKIADVNYPNYPVVPEMDGQKLHKLSYNLFPTHRKSLEHFIARHYHFQFL